MGKAYDKWKQISADFIGSFFPKEINRPECVSKLLQALYPTLDWNIIKFYDRLPWWVQQGTGAITLPGYTFKDVNIYFDKDFDPCTCKGLGTIVHESFHALQYHDTGPGIGFSRPFMAYYLACTIKHGYDDNPMEVIAYEFEQDFLSCCKQLETQGFKVCNCDNPAETVRFDPVALEKMLDGSFSLCDNLPKVTSNFTYDCGRYNLVMGKILTGLITVLKPITTVIVFFIGTIVLWVLTGIAVILEATGLDCDWAIEWEDRCTNWRTTKRQECDQYRDDGYRACASLEDRGYKNCCTWKPCSWFCRAWVWVSNWVCVAHFWVSNLVCIAWVTIVSSVCIAFTRVIKALTCI